MTSHSPTHFFLGEIFAADTPTGQLRGIIASVSDDGHSGDLVLVPDGIRQVGLNRVQLRDPWVPVDTAGPWYVELWAADGKRASWHAQVPTIEFVVALAKDARARNLGEIVRIIMPTNATPLDFAALSEFQVERIG